MRQPLAQHHAEGLVAFGLDGERWSARQLAADARKVAAALPNPASGTHVLLVFRTDRYAFTAALLGTWIRGHVVALPPNTRRDAVLEIAGLQETAAIIHDTDAGIGLHINDLLSRDIDDLPMPSLDFPSDRLAARLYSSGSTGRITAWPKTFGQLLGEATLLADAFLIIPDMHLVATVPVGHIYGLLFTVLLPLVSGAAFGRDTFLHAEPIARQISQVGAQVLVTVPIHLRGLVQADPGALKSLDRVFCSTAPLSADAGLSFAEHHDKVITEILGSTETGGIAWRAQPGEEQWTPMPGICVDTDAEGYLCVDSPLIGPDSNRPFRTGDLAEMRADGSFVHRGRSDGVVKIGGNRVSIAVMEQHLRQLADVADAAVIAVPAKDGRDQQLCAAIVSDQWTSKQLRSALLDWYEPTCVPRRFVFVDALPREDNGKMQRGQLLQLFGLLPDGTAPQWSVAVKEEQLERDSDQYTQRFCVQVPENYGWFMGHFPSYPILAAAVQLREIVVPCIRRARPELADVVRMEKLKFLNRIQPGDQVDATLTWKPDSSDVEFALHRSTELCSSGRIRLAG